MRHSHGDIHGDYACVRVVPVWHETHTHAPLMGEAWCVGLSRANSEAQDYQLHIAASP